MLSGIREVSKVGAQGLQTSLEEQEAL